MEAPAAMDVSERCEVPAWGSDPHLASASGRGRVLRPLTARDEAPVTVLRAEPFVERQRSSLRIWQGRNRLRPPLSPLMPQVGATRVRETVAEGRNPKFPHSAVWIDRDGVIW